MFYGGIDVPPKGVTKPNQWGVKIDKPGKYYVINIGNNSNAVARSPSGEPSTVVRSRSQPGG